MPEILRCNISGIILNLKAMGIEEEDLVQYRQSLLLFNRSADYLGKSKGLAFHYNRNILLSHCRFTARRGKPDDRNDQQYQPPITQQHCFADIKEHATA